MPCVMPSRGRAEYRAPLATLPASLRDDEGSIACKEQALVTAREEEMKFGSSGRFMSGQRLSSIFLAQRRGGAEKKSSEPYNSPDHSRQGFGMGLCLPSSSPRLCASARKSNPPRSLRALREKHPVLPVGRSRSLPGREGEVGPPGGGGPGLGPVLQRFGLARPRPAD